MVIRRIALSVLFFVCIQFFLFTVLLYKYPLELGAYLNTQIQVEAADRFGELYETNLHVDKGLDKIKQGFLSFAWSYNMQRSLEELRTGRIDAYLTHTDSLEVVQSRQNAFRIIGRNVFARGTAFLVREDSSINLEDVPSDLFYYYFRWIRNIFLGSLGMVANGKSTIAKLLLSTLPITISLVLYSIIISLFVAIDLAYLIMIFMNRHARAIENFFELSSSFPDFVIAFFFLYLFKYRLGIIDGYLNAFLEFKFNLLFYLFFPALTIAISNGNISYLLKVLLEKMEEVKTSPSFVFMQKNGMRKRYLYFVFILKEILPITFNYISQKIPLYIGAAIVAEWMFDIEGIGYTIVDKFKDFDLGVVLIIISLLYLISISFDIVADVVSKAMNPREYRRND